MPREDLGRHSRRAEQPPPIGEHQWVAQLLERGRIGDRTDPLRRRHGQHPDLSRLDECHGLAETGGQQVDLAAEQREHGLAATVVRQVTHGPRVDFHEAQRHRQNDVVETATCGAAAHREGTGVPGEFRRHGMPRRARIVGANGQYAVVGNNPGHGSQIPETVREEALQTTHQQRRRIHQQRRLEPVGVIEKIGHGAPTAAPGNVFERDLLHEVEFDEYPTDFPRRTIETAARSGGYHDMQAFRRGCRAGRDHQPGRQPRPRFV